MNSIIRHIPFASSVRASLRSRFFAMLRHVADLEDTRQILTETLGDYNLFDAVSRFPQLENDAPPFADLGTATREHKTRLRDDVIFITGRFRSGSTLLWHIFRRISSVTAYYEPFNERRWFETTTRGSRVDSTHLNVTEYWSEYEGLERLSQYYDEAWIRRQLVMSERSWNANMQKYIEALIEASKGRPVLQFNRVDFRLPWLRRAFPRARLLHVFRHPRDQWCSTLGDIGSFPKHGALRDFEPVDRFYLLMWARDIKRSFPFLSLDEDSHPYKLFYQIWKLSYLFGTRYADLSIALEELLADPGTQIARIFECLAVDDIDVADVVPLVKPVKTGKWRQYADDAWFSSIESEVEGTLDDYFRQY